MSERNENIEPPVGFAIRVDATAGPAERRYVLEQHGIEVSRHHTRGGALLAAMRMELEAKRRKA